MADQIINSLSAGMAGLSIPDYIANHEDALKILDKIEAKIKSFKIITIDIYNKACEIKSMLSSMYCYCFNNKKDEFKRVSALEDAVGNKIAKFARNYKKITPIQRKIGRYLLWRRRLIGVDINKVIDDVIEADMLRKKNGKYFIIGINLSVGDNVFGFSDRTGQQWRKYNKVCCFMAIGISWADRRTEMLDKKDIPEMEEHYKEFYAGDYKGGVKVSMPYDDRHYIYNTYCN